VWLGHCVCGVGSVRCWWCVSGLFWASVSVRRGGFYGLSVQVKTWVKPQERTLVSASLRDFAMVVDCVATSLCLYKSTL